MTTTATQETEYLSCADTAKLVRQALKAVFPSVKFSVRSKVYSGGASIDVSWTDGPRTKTVEAVAGQFAGADFDGMVDLKVYNTHYIAPNGSPVLGHRPSTNGSFEEINGGIPDVEGVRRVHFGADFIFCSRRLAQEEWLTEQARTMILSGCKIEGEGRSARFGNQWVDDLARGMAYSLDFLTGTTLEQTFREVVFHERD